MPQSQQSMPFNQILNLKKMIDFISRIVYNSCDSTIQGKLTMCKTTYCLLKKDNKFLTSTKKAAWIAVGLGLSGALYNLDHRVSALEELHRGSVDVELEPIEAPVKMPVSRVQVRPKDDHISLLHNSNYKIVMDQRDIDCLAKNIFHEARFEPYIGKIAVAQITFNRVLDGRWGDSICKVVYAHKQFSWTLKPRLVNKELKGAKWQQALHAAKMFQNGVRVRNLAHAKWYHAEYVSPKWQDDYKRIHQYGLHIFYEEKKHNNLTERDLLMAKN